jgi:hypothetical protein
MALHFKSFVPRTRSKAVFVMVMACYCVAITGFVSTWRYVAHVKSPTRAFYLHGDTSDVVYVLAVAPMIESFVLAGAIELIRKIRGPVVLQVLLAAVLVSLAHAWPWWPHAAIVLPAFCIQAACYLYWRGTSWKIGYWLVVAIHSLSNLTPALSIIGRASRHA